MAQVGNLRYHAVAHVSDVRYHAVAHVLDVRYHAVAHVSDVRYHTVTQVGNLRYILSGERMSPRALKTIASAAALTASLTGLMLAPALKDLLDRKPTGARGIVTLEGAYRLCRKTNMQSWELVDFATRLVHDKFRVYSVRNLWDTPALAFKYGMGYCAQYNLALAQLLRRLGFEVQPVFALRIESQSHPEWRMGHTWLRVTVDGETRDVCAGNADNTAGAVDFRPLTKVYTGAPPVLLASHLGLIWYAGVLEWGALLTRQPRPAWMWEPR